MFYYSVMTALGGGKLHAIKMRVRSVYSFKTMCVRLFLLFCVVAKVDNFSYNKAASIVIEPDDSENKNSSYFGYSVSLRAGTEPLIVVGAPRASSLHSVDRGIRTPGAIYFCYIQNGNKAFSCRQRYLDTDGNTRHVLENGMSYYHKKDSMWLGMAVDGMDYTNGTIAMCAPRWINQFHPDFYLANGLCYSLSNTEKTNSDTTALLIPLVNQNNQGFMVTNPDLQPSYGVNTYFYAYGEAGMSVRLTADGKELLIGAPGVYIWTGTVIRYKVVKQKNGPDYFQKTNVPNPFYTTDMKDSSYFGYSVDSGKFSSDSELSYVAGAPRAGYTGKVYVFEFPIKDNGRYVIQASLEGDQMGSYFGSTICSVDLNSDGLSDLLIGAPLYTFLDLSDVNGLPYDQGRVYVYMNNDKAKFTLQSGPIIGGRIQNGARFGSTVSVLGDIDGDGYKDVAIGSPFEDFGAGAVYIYLGSRDGLNPSFSQRISFQDSKGLGISISRGVDIDANGCNDIAVGSFLSNKAYLIKCHPTFRVVATISTPDTKELPSNATTFTANFCMRISGRTHSTTRITVKLGIDPIYRRATLVADDDIYEVNVHTKSFLCSEKKISIKPTNKDFSRPIELVMEYDLKHNPIEDEVFCADCPVLAPDAVKKVSVFVPLASGCGLDLVCQSDLQLNVAVLTSLPYVIGSSTSIKLNVSVINIAEPAFLASITIYIPIRTQLVRVPPTCHLSSAEEQLVVLICDLDNPLIARVERYAIVEIDTKSLDSSDEFLYVNATATSVGEEVTPDNNKVELKLELKATAAIEVFGESSPSEYIYVNTEDPLSSDSNNIRHSFEIMNHGPTTWDSVIMRFYIPIGIVSGKHNLTIFNVLQPTTSLNMQLINCHIIMGALYEETEEGYSVDIKNNSNAISRRRRALDNRRNDKNEDAFRELTEHSSDMQVDLPADSSSYSSELSQTTVYVNCSSENLNVRCLVMECEGGPLVAKATGARVSFPIKPELKNIGQLFEGHNTVVISSHVLVEPKDERKWKVSADLPSIFVLQSSQTSVPWWVIAISLICGTLVLLLISWALYKFGFFHRKTREELQLLKNQDQENMELKNENDEEDE